MTSKGEMAQEQYQGERREQAVALFDQLRQIPLSHFGSVAVGDLLRLDTDGAPELEVMQRIALAAGVDVPAEPLFDPENTGVEE